jgi:hypothetical protein
MDILKIKNNMDKFMKFWGKYGYMFHLGCAVLSFLAGDNWIGITNILLALPLFIEAKTKSYE